MNKAVAEIQKVNAIEDAARSAGIDHCIEPCVRQGGDVPNANVVRSAVFAVIAAVWQDCHHDFGTTCSAFEKLG